MTKNLKDYVGKSIDQMISLFPGLQGQGSEPGILDVIDYLETSDLAEAKDLKAIAQSLFNLWSMLHELEPQVDQEQTNCPGI